MRSICTLEATHACGKYHHPIDVIIMKRLPPIHTFLVLSLLFISACGGGGSGESADTPSSDAPAEAAADSTPLGSASISGTISFEGTAPAMPTVRMNRECSEVSEGHKALNVVVNENGTLKNVFVHITAGLPDGYSYASPSEPVVFDQHGCMYIPHVFGVQVGQEIKVLNSDPFLHNLHALAEKNRPFNFGMPKQGDERLHSFRVTETMLKIKCDVHPWMGAYAGVVDHPYYSVSGDDGNFAIADLPAGTYTVTAWHEEYGESVQTVTISDGESANISFSFASAS